MFTFQKLLTIVCLISGYHHQVTQEPGSVQRITPDGMETSASSRLRQSSPVLYSLFGKFRDRQISGRGSVHSKYYN